MLKLIELAITARYDLVGGQLGRGYLAHVQRLAGVLVRGGDAAEHLGVFPADEGGAVGLGNREIGELVPAGAGLDGLEDLTHGCATDR